MPSELELSMIQRLEALEKKVTALEKRLAGLSTELAEAQRRAPEKKEGKDAKK